jgi:amidohydrolase
LKASVVREIDSRRQQLQELSLKIHANPELGLHEIKAAGWLTQYLEESGVTIERGICQLETAFKAVYGQGKPAIALLAEYDALPEIGHACGHNIIAVSAAGAAVASKKAVDACGGTVMVIGTPAEESHGGKAIMAEKGAFDGIDAAMMVHPGMSDIATVKTLAVQSLKVEFFGREAHAASEPENGINALEAMIQSFNAINSVRQHIRSSARIHGIISDGGKAANVVPAYSAASFMVRAADLGYLEELKQKVLNCFIGAATASGARLEYRWDKVKYAPLRNNLALAELFRHNIELLGRNMVMGVPGGTFGSTDFGNVSHLVPGIQPLVAITTKQARLHTREFMRAAGSEEAMKGLIDAAKALAMTVVDLLSEPANMQRVKEEFTGK